jgi:hypothetical protein
MNFSGPSKTLPGGSQSGFITEARRFMTTGITRGLGGRKEVQLLLVTLIVGAIAILVMLLVRQKLAEPQGVVAVARTPEEVLKLGPRARGPARVVALHTNDTARVVAFAPGEQPNTHEWQGVPADTIIAVTGLNFAGEEVWVHGLIQHRGDAAPIILHASFLEPYTPLLLDKAVEIADVKLVSATDGGKARIAVNGWLRNMSSQTISQCVITCTFQDHNEHAVDIYRSEATVLPMLELVGFHTHMTDKAFASIAVQITYATPEGLRNYLPQVVIQKSNL